MQSLLVQAGYRCALPVTSVLETMRPLPVEPMRGLPEFVQGVSVIRGVATLVVDLPALLGKKASAAITRFVTVRVKDRRIALAVESILGVRVLDLKMQPLPPLLEASDARIARSLVAQDRELLLLLEESRLVPDEVWKTFDKRGPAS